MLFSPVLASLLTGCVSGRINHSRQSFTTSDPAVANDRASPSQEPHLSHQQLVRLVCQHSKYVFVIYQENRSFDSYFGTFSGTEGIYSQPPDQAPGFYQEIINTNGSISRIQPLRIRRQQFAADLDDVGHAYPIMTAKMRVIYGTARMDRYALTEEERYAHGSRSSLEAKPSGELTMAYVDGQTIPFLGRYANRFMLFIHIFQTMVGPSTAGSFSIIVAQSGQTQAALYANELYHGKGAPGPGESVVSGSDPFWGSPENKTTVRRQPVNPKDFPHPDGQLNQTYATLPPSLPGDDAAAATADDRNGRVDLADLRQEVAFLTHDGQKTGAVGLVSGRL